ncbi:recombinase family protein [Ruegeria pomeroyi]|uniref:Recombinase family protein n=1 Tax=Ruegeria pomeroyi TaxID=89184 RepID=A0A850LDP6_9RHOB|nr:recombinase family protein [Ruegeria pomeroyi]NVK96211.1 recombinase family protein [Ruegeria pomeroyi]NVL00823.1 recombinase family protein [Ruegeria pomeroyi]QWV08511.1 recombinase family protein [Ruegeria pomeroyi]
MIIGYARVSTTDQNLDAQTDAPAAAGAERLFSAQRNTTRTDCRGLDKMFDRHCIFFSSLTRCANAIGISALIS